MNRRAGSHRRGLAAIVVALCIVASPAPAVATTAPADATAAPWVGLLAPTDAQFDGLAGSAVTRVMVSAGWNSLEPLPGVFNPFLLDQLRRRVADAAARGFEVVVDPGLQYPPSWVFSLPGQTRFVDQYGDAWHGGLSADVANAVANPAVRAAQGTYLATLGSALRGAPVAALRAGGLISGELQYPPNTYAGHTDALWFFDPAMQATAPVPGWRPGTGSAADARASLQRYFDALTGYAAWQLRALGAAFPGADLQLMMPSWGLRPGMVDAAVATGLAGRSVAETNGMVANGLDWVGQARAAAATGLPVTLYCTWVDAPSQGTTVQQIPPVAYLAQLGAQNGLPVAGENTGRGGLAALDTTLQRLRSYHLSGVMYMSGDLIANGQAGISLAALRTRAAGAVG